MLPDSQKGFAPVIHGSPAARRRCQSGKTATKSTRAQCRRDHLPSTISTPRAMAAICRSRSKKRMAPAGLQRARQRCRFSSVKAIPASPSPPGSTAAATVSRKRPIFPGTVMHGLPAGWTLYGGTQLADRYRAFNLGVGKTWAISAPCRWISLRPTPPR